MAADDAVREQLQALGAFIRAQRTQAQMSLRDLADLTNVSNPYLSQIERGLHEPSVRVLKSIAEALNVSIDTLLIRAGLVTEPRPRGGRADRGPPTPPPPSPPTPRSPPSSADRCWRSTAATSTGVGHARPRGATATRSGTHHTGPGVRATPVPWRHVADVTLTFASKGLTFHALLEIVSTSAAGTSPPAAMPPRGRSPWQPPPPPC